MYLEPIAGAENLRIERVRYRRKAIMKLGPNDSKFPALQAVLVEGRPAVIYSAEDLTGGLVGYHHYGLDGYHPGEGDDPGSAYRVMRNIVLFAHAKAAEAQPDETKDESAKEGK